MADQEDAQSLRDRIVDTAIDLAEQEGWEGLRLRKVAERCGVDLTDALSQFRDIDAVADAWFERALAAMLQPPEPDLQGRPASERVHAVMMRWFEANEWSARCSSRPGFGAEQHRFTEGCADRLPP